MKTRHENCSQGGVLGGEKVDVEKNIKKGDASEIRQIRKLGGVALRQSHKARPTDPLDTL